MKAVTLVKALIPTALHRGPLIRRTREGIVRSAIVRGGPFRGMKYVHLHVGARLLPKLLGTYELEIVPALSTIPSLSVQRIVDVGAGEGYYAVGLAMKNPDVVVVAYEQDPEGQTAIDELARLNGVAGRVEARGHCGVAELAEELARGRPGFLLMDVEGAEEDLLDPRSIPAMRDWHILFEAHDIFRPGIGKRVSQRFAGTHTIQEIRSRPRSVDDITFLGPIFKRYALRHCIAEWTAERTEPMSWYFLRPKGGMA